MTPRKTRQRHQTNPSQSHPVPVQASDYESEAYYTAPAETRTVDEINFSVIKRYVPSLTSILSIAPSAQIYTFAKDTNTWDKTNIEGTLFVCQLTPSPITGSERHCIVVLNRKGMENLIIESGEIESVEITAQFLLLTFKQRQGTGEGAGFEFRTLGFFIQTGGDNSRRELVCQMIKNHWEVAMGDREWKEDGLIENFADEGFESVEGKPQNRPMGRRLSLTELFGQR